MKKKGFTLIELLAVIVILAIIALIATPIILNIIEKARKEAFVDTAYGIINAAELQYTEGIMNNKVEEKLYTFPQKGEDKLKFSGAEPKGGDIKISSTGKVSIAIHNGDWCIRKSENESKVTVEEYSGNCLLEQPLVYTKEECFVFDENTGTITYYMKDDEDCGVDVVIPESINGVTVKAIGEYAFVKNYNCYSDDSKQITSVILPSGLEVIEEYAFVGGKDYEGDAYKIPESDENNIVRLGMMQLNDNYSCGRVYCFNAIKEVDFSRCNKLRVIGDKAFYNNALTKIELPNSITSIGEEAFKYNQLTSLILGNSITYIGVDAFYENQLTSVIIPSSVKEIGSSAFGYNQLTSLTLGNGVTSIGHYAFGNNQLTTVRIPNSVTSIGNYAFGHNQLTSVEIPDSVTSIGDQAFARNQLTSVIIPSSVKEIGIAAFNDNQLPDSQAFMYARNEDGSEDFTKLIGYGGAKRDSIVIPDEVIIIGDYAFWYDNLTSVTIPSNVTIIGNLAFSLNQLTSVEIPSSVTSIGGQAFAYNQLTSVVIKGKSSSSDFGSYPEDSWSAPFGWASGYSDDNIIWNG